MTATSQSLLYLLKPDLRNTPWRRRDILFPRNYALTLPRRSLPKPPTKPITLHR